MNLPSESNVTVELSPEEALLFVAFQKRHAFIQLLDSLGAFDIKSGTLTVNFDNLGGIGSIDISRHYKKP